MPKVKPFGAGPSRRKSRCREMEDRIVERYGMLLTTADLGRVLGMANYDCIKDWVRSEGIEPVPIGKRNRWDARDVAKAIYNASFRSNAV